MKDYYQILAVLPTATQTEIRKAFYKLAKKYHPDKNPDAAHHQKFLEINEAYETLGDKDKRANYHYRWVNFKNQPKASAQQTHTGRPQPHYSQRPQNTYRPPQPPPPFFRKRYQKATRNTFKQYEPRLRRVCQIVLLLGLLLTADKFLAHQLENQTVTHIAYPAINAGSEAPVYITTPQARFKVNVSDFENVFFSTGQQLTLWRTPLFSQITHVSAYQEKQAINKGTVYHNFFVLVLVQMAAAAAGLHKKFPWSARLNASIIAGCFGAITLLVLFMGF